MLSNISNHQFNLSIEKGTFPNQFKIAKVTQFFKRGDNVLMDNYHTSLYIICMYMYVCVCVYIYIYIYIK